MHDDMLNDGQFAEEETFNDEQFAEDESFNGETSHVLLSYSLVFLMKLYFGRLN